MRSIRLNKTILSIVSITSLASSLAIAQLTPGPGHGNGGGHNPPPHYNPCDVPTDPNCPGHGGNGNGNGGYNPPHNPGHGNGNGNGGYYPPHNPGHGNGNGNGGYYPPNDPYYPPSNPYYPPNDPYYPPSNPGYNNSNVVRSVYINRAVWDQTINLNDMISLSQYDGYRVVSVSADTTPNSPYRTTALLLQGGYVYDTQINPGYQIYLIPQSTMRLNRYGSDLYLQIQGGTYIEKIRIELSRY